MKNLFTIGEVSKLFDINIRTLRYYDDISLLKPEFINEDTNYRYYSTKQFEKLNTIKYLRALNMPISQINTFFQNKDVETMLNILENQKEVVIDMKNELEIIQKKIENRLNQIKDAQNSIFDEVIVKTILKREILIIKKDFSTSDDLEYPIRNLEKLSGEKSPIFLGKIGVSIDLNKIKKSHFNEFSSIFIILDSEDVKNEKTEYLSEGLYATIRYKGTHKESGDSYKKLNAFIKRNFYVPINDSIEITMIDSGMTNNEEKFVTELQIPIKRIDTLVSR